jgi:hypothetical protein
LVENKDVKAAMVAMYVLVPQPMSDEEFRKSGVHLDPVAKMELQQLSLKLAGACRASLDLSYGIKAWTSPDLAAQEASIP